MMRLLRAAAVWLLGSLVPAAALAALTPVTGTQFSITGQLANVGSSSTSIGGLTTSPNSASWAMPLAGGVVRIKLLGTSTGGTSGPQVGVCPLGGTCSCTNAPDILLLGETGEYNIGTAQVTPPTVIACGGSTGQVGIEAR
jgi:hypothetical protein